MKPARRPTRAAATTAASAAASIAVVSSPPSPSPTRGSRSSRVGSSVEHPPDGGRRVAADLEPVDAGHSSKGERRSPLVSLGKKYVLFGGMRTPARANSSTCSTVGGRTRNAAVASPLATARSASAALAVYATLRERERVDERRVERVLAALDERRRRPGGAARRPDGRGRRPPAPPRPRRAGERRLAEPAVQLRAPRRPSAGASGRSRGPRRRGATSTARTWAVSSVPSSSW